MSTSMVVEIDDKIAIEMSDIWIISREYDTRIYLKTKYNSSFTLNVSDKESADIVYDKLIKAFKLSKNAAYNYDKEIE